tara:strand:+ start:3465 stop:3836 length:372 start_codon:yes stop_codon:yes gene_type:complete
MTNSISKGKRGEREWAKWLRDNCNCQNARRGQQYQGGADSPDVVCGIPNTHCEVKRVEKLNLGNAMAQAVADSGGNSIPYVAHRKNLGDWMVTVRADDLVAFSEMVLGEDGKSKMETWRYGNV